MYNSKLFNASALFPGGQPCFTCTCFTVLHVHVSQLYMYMFYCFTCTSKTMLHTEAFYVTLRDKTLSIPEKEIDGNDRGY